MKRQPIHTRVKKVIEERRQQLQKEIAVWEDKLRGTEEYWGFNGPWRQQDAALQRRRKELDELEEYERQLGKYRPTKEVRMYAMYCRNCGNVFMSNLTPKGEWSECPCCKKMVYDNNPQLKTFRIEDDGQRWLEAFIEDEFEKALKEVRT